MIILRGQYLLWHIFTVQYRLTIIMFPVKAKRVQELRQQILQYFHYVSSGQNVVQCIKQALFLHDKFNPLLLFQLVSQGKRQMSKHDWSIFLQQQNIHFEKQEIDYLFKHYSFPKFAIFNDFMQALIPYNADVLRIFKKNYLQSIQLLTLDQQVNFIFRQLMAYWIQFARNLIKIRKQLSLNANTYDILQLVQQDLVEQNKKRDKIRESVKYKQFFEQRKHQLSYNELRRFLQLWEVGDQRNIEYDLLQIKRHLKNSNPFQNIYWKQSKSNHNSLAKARSSSTGKFNKSKNIVYSSNKKYQTKDDKRDHNNFNEQDKYANFKQDIYDKYKYKEYNNQNTQITHENQSSKFKPQSAQISGRKISRNLQQQFQLEPKKFGSTAKKNQTLNKTKNKQQYLRNIRYARDKKCINGILIVNVFAEISQKQQLLQKLRKKLASNDNFNLINLFKLIDHRNKGYITQKQIQQFMEDKAEMYFQLVRNMQRERDRLRFQDFCMIFRPLSKKLNDVLDQKPEHRVPNPFKRQTMSILKQVIRLTAQLFQNLKVLKQRINDEGIQPYALFEYIDVKDKGFIQAQDIKDLLDQKSIICQTNNLKCIMKLFNKKVNQQISESQFSRFIDL